ncbi:MAG TPA: response regulator, partial [Polyangiaceae bacterium]|nr:response regulator [Polyangiaceae bacterium]
MLLVDDEEDLVWSLARRLRRALVGASVEGTARPEEALTTLAAGPVDVLVTDVRMPNVSGLELVVGARKKWPSLPLIVVTAYPTEFMRAAPRRDGAVVYLEKPFELLNLVRQVDRAFTQGARPWFGAEVEREMPLDLVQLFALSNLTGALRL